ncbi:hypothetical protein [Alysiella crassa]|uniref:Uncharacterized protein n=1 Tax=Alysiella crassa TaxID=153491 RepID=A0A376BV80_9NEIS|nr:hypothetical protein [Alysiella crassa]UOP06223.1 hypothetical protein LVJ80_10405 [Alysiella crassa]SSY80705.1 Uncharacterised protein [Alysiella crassa]
MSFCKRKNISDREILKIIYYLYFEEFDKLSDSKILIQIDLEKISIKSNVSTGELFGRIYHYLHPKYKFTHEIGSSSSLFHINLQNGKNKQCSVNFPILCSVLGQLEEDFYNKKLTLSIAFLSMFISLISLVITILFK